MENDSTLHGRRTKSPAKIAKVLFMMVISVVVVNVLIYLSTMITGKPIEHGILMDMIIPVLCAFMMI